MYDVSKKKAILDLRRQGHSYGEILRQFPDLSRGTLSKWCNTLQLTRAELKLLESRIGANRDRSRLFAAKTNHKKRLDREALISLESNEEFEKYRQDPFFVFGVALYWAEGAKTSRRFQFINSDPYIMQLMVKWIEKYLKIDKKDFSVRLYIHKIYSSEECHDFWAEALDIPKALFSKPVFKKTPHVLKRKESYKGCIRIDLPKVRPWLIVNNWQRSLGDSYLRP